MNITFDPEKRAKTLQERGLDFAEADRVFAEINHTIEDNRFAYPEPRSVTFGRLEGRMVVIVWTPTADGRRIISMRKANEREQKKLKETMG